MYERRRHWTWSYLRTTSLLPGSQISIWITNTHTQTYWCKLYCIWKKVVASQDRVPWFLSLVHYKQQEISARLQKSPRGGRKGPVWQPRWHPSSDSSCPPVLLLWNLLKTISTPDKHRAVVHKCFAANGLLKKRKTRGQSISLNTGRRGKKGSAMWFTAAFLTTFCPWRVIVSLVAGDGAADKQGTKQWEGTWWRTEIRQFTHCFWVPEQREYCDGMKKKKKHLVTSFSWDWIP